MAPRSHGPRWLDTHRMAEDYASLAFFPGRTAPCPGPGDRLVRGNGLLLLDGLEHILAMRRIASCSLARPLGLSRPGPTAWQLTLASGCLLTGGRPSDQQQDASATALQ